MQSTNHAVKSGSGDPGSLKTGRGTKSFGRRTRRRPRGATQEAFTLVEMLVVITIIGILVALLIPTVAGVMRRTRVSTMAMEMQDIARAIEAYKVKNGDYPPDFTQVAAVTAHVARAYPRNTRNVAGWINAAAVSGKRTVSNLDPAEALVFWLAMLGTNPRDPLGLANDPNPGDPASYFQFDETRLTCPLFPTQAELLNNQAPDLDGDWWPEYMPKHGNQAPYVYFDGRLISGAYAYTSARYPVNPNSALISTIGEVRPYRSNQMIDARDANRTRPRPTVLTNTSDPQYRNRTQWINPGKFQLICAGIDNNFGRDRLQGTVVIYKQFPDPKFTDQTVNIAGAPDEDNLSDFSEMKTFGEAVP